MSRAPEWNEPAELVEEPLEDRPGIRISWPPSPYRWEAWAFIVGVPAVLVVFLAWRFLTFLEDLPDLDPAGRFWLVIVAGCLALIGPSMLVLLAVQAWTAVVDGALEVDSANLTAIHEIGPFRWRRAMDLACVRAVALARRVHEIGGLCIIGRSGEHLDLGVGGPSRLALLKRLARLFRDRGVELDPLLMSYLWWSPTGEDPVPELRPSSLEAPGPPPAGRLRVEEMGDSFQVLWTDRLFDNRLEAEPGCVRTGTKLKRISRSWDSSEACYSRRMRARPRFPGKGFEVEGEDGTVLWFGSSLSTEEKAWLWARLDTLPEAERTDPHLANPSPPPHPGIEVVSGRREAFEVSLKTGSIWGIETVAFILGPFCLGLALWNDPPTRPTDYWWIAVAVILVLGLLAALTYELVRRRSTVLSLRLENGRLRVEERSWFRCRSWEGELEGSDAVRSIPSGIEAESGEGETFTCGGDLRRKSRIWLHCALQSAAEAQCGGHTRKRFERKEGT